MRVPLYSTTKHDRSRITLVGIVGFVAFGLLVGGKDFVSRPSPLQLAMLAVFVTIVCALAKTILRARPVFGTAEGLVAMTRKGQKTIPWSRVGEVEVPISSFNPFFRTYYVTVRGEPTRIYFFAGRPEIERLERFRQDFAEIA